MINVSESRTQFALWCIIKTALCAFPFALAGCLTERVG